MVGRATGGRRFLATGASADADIVKRKRRTTRPRKKSIPQDTEDESKILYKLLDSEPIFKSTVINHHKMTTQMGKTPYERESELKFQSLAKRQHSIYVSTITSDKKYCEFQQMLYLYTNTKKVYNASVSFGTQKHKQDEDMVHPQIGVALVDQVRNLELQRDFDYNDSLFDKERSADLQVTEEELKQTESIIAETENTFEENEIDDLSYDFTTLTIPVAEKQISNHQVNIENLDKFENRLTDFLLDLPRTFDRICQLLTRGQCNEIRVFGHYHEPTTALLSNNNPFNGRKDEYITISGKCDALEMQEINAGAMDSYLKEISVTNKMTNFDDWFKVIKEKYFIWNDELPINVKELKTTMSFNIQANQKNSAFNQSAIYLKFLKDCSQNPTMSFHNFYMTCEKRGLNIYQPLSGSLIKLIALSNRFLFEDFLNLKNGERVSYGEELDSLVYSAASADEYILTLTENESYLLNELNGQWAMAPTLANIIARICQVQTLLHFSPTMKAEFFNSIKGFTNTYEEDYREGQVEKLIDDKMQLWLGKREPELTYADNVCKTCTFRKHCLKGRGELPTNDIIIEIDDKLSTKDCIKT